MLTLTGVSARAVPTCADPNVRANAATTTSAVIFEIFMRAAT